MKGKLVLLASYFIVTPVFIFLLIIYQLFLMHQNSQLSPKTLSLSLNNKVAYKAIPPGINETAISLSAKEARVEVLQEFFGRYNSPLYDYAKNVVETADKYGLDYRLIPAIAMQESTLCKKMPINSFNCWGFGIYGKKITKFKNFAEGIETVTKTLSRDYHNKGLQDPYAIMSKYTPSSSGSWAENVSYIMNQIQASL